MNLSEETQNICSSIDKSTLYDDPFYHLYINNFFRNEFYLNILKYLPTKDQYMQINKTKSVDKNYSDERYILNITPDTFKTFHPEQKSFFGQVVTSLMSVDFFNSVTKKFNDKITKVNPQNIDLRIALVKDLTKYNLGAHTDTNKKFMTFLFYLPEDQSHKHIGTSMYKLKDNAKFNSSQDGHYSDEETKELFEEVKLAEFVPNSVLIFPRTDFSFHGVSSINTGSYERNLLLLNYYYK